MNKTIYTATALILVLSSYCLCQTARAEAEHQAAVWKTQKAHFDFLGFTTNYSCEGLRGKIRQVLHDLGAREDFKVTALGCDAGKPTPLPAVDIELTTLKHADPPATIDAVWKEVELGGIGKLQGGDCELAEQIVQKILPLFEVRKVHMSTACKPHQMPTGALSLKLEVLTAVTTP